MQIHNNLRELATLIAIRVLKEQLQAMAGDGALSPRAHRANLPGILTAKHPTMNHAVWS